MLAEEERFATWRLALADGSLVGYGKGGAHLFAAMRLTRPIGRLLARAPAHLVDRVYEVLARVRAPLGRVVPDRPGPRRYP